MLIAIAIIMFIMSVRRKGLWPALKTLGSCVFWSICVLVMIGIGDYYFDGLILFIYTVTVGIDMYKNKKVTKDTIKHNKYSDIGEKLVRDNMLDRYINSTSYFERNKILEKYNARSEK